jgi:hypothetical protein
MAHSDIAPDACLILVQSKLTLNPKRGHYITLGFRLMVLFFAVSCPISVFYLVISVHCLADFVIFLYGRPG